MTTSNHVSRGTENAMELFSWVVKISQCIFSWVLKIPWNKKKFSWGHESLPFKRKTKGFSWYHEFNIPHEYPIKYPCGKWCYNNGVFIAMKMPLKHCSNFSCHFDGFFMAYFSIKNISWGMKRARFMGFLTGFSLYFNGIFSMK